MASKKTQKSQAIAVENIVVDERCQHRAKIQPDTVEDYTGLYTEHGEQGMPPIEVYELTGDSEQAGYCAVVDGFHRFAAAQKAGLGFIRAIVVGKGDIDEAGWYALKANHDHGLRRTNEDKRTAVWDALDNPIGVEQSNVVLAEQCGVGEALVRRIRQEWEAAHSGSFKTNPTKRTGRDGKSYPAQSGSAEPNQESSGGSDGSGSNDWNPDDGGGEPESSSNESAKPEAGTDSAPALPPYVDELEEIVELGRKAKGAATRAEKKGLSTTVVQSLQRTAGELRREADMRKPVTCPWCEGSGDCAQCEGCGWVERSTAKTAEQGRKHTGHLPGEGAA